MTTDFVSRYQQQLTSLHVLEQQLPSEFATIQFDPLVERLRQGVALTSLQLEQRLQTHLQQRQAQHLQQLQCCPLQAAPGVVILKADPKHAMSIDKHSQVEHLEQQFRCCQALSLPAMSVAIDCSESGLDIELTAEAPLSAWPLYLQAEQTELLQVITLLQSSTIAEIMCDDARSTRQPCAELFTFPELAQPWLPQQSTTLLYAQLLTEMIAYPQKSGFCTLDTLPCQQISIRITWPDAIKICSSLQIHSHCFAVVDLFSHKAKMRCLDANNFYYSCELPEQTRCFALCESNATFIHPGTRAEEVFCHASESIKAPWLYLYHVALQIDNTEAWQAEQQLGDLMCLQWQPASTIAADDMLQAYLAWRDDQDDPQRILSLLSVCHFSQLCSYIKTIQVQKKFVLDAATVQQQLCLTVVLLTEARLDCATRKLMLFLKQLYSWHSATSTHVICQLE